jgi:hypothetical protein
MSPANAKEFRKVHRLNRILLLCACAAVAQASTITVVPNSLTSTEGNSNNDWPFAISLRYQQVYAASQFANGGLITQIAFRPDATLGDAFSEMIANIHIDLSTTSATPDALSSTLDNNVGADDQVVYAGSLGISTSFTGPAGGPKAFDIITNLTTPFFYNPSRGNLLLDVINFSGASPPTCASAPCIDALDAESTLGDSVSRIWSPIDGNSFPLLGQDTSGLVTQFTIVPEPGTFSLFVISFLWLVGWGLIRWRNLAGRRPFLSPKATRQKK